MDNNQTGRAKTVSGAGYNDPLQVSAAVTLQPGQNHVEAIIPLLVADAYIITLPPVGSCAGEKFFIHGIRASGTYSGGTVGVDDQDDNLDTDVSSDDITTSHDYVVVENFAGKLWTITPEKTT